MSIYTVYYRKDFRDLVYTAPECLTAIQADDLENLFDVLNHHELPCRSMSVGDVAEDESGVMFIVMPCGFRELCVNEKVYVRQTAKGEAPTAFASKPDCDGF